MSIRSILLTVSFLFFLPAPASAAPQILGVVAMAEPMPLVCQDGICAAEFSTFCLQKRRDVPVPGTVYDPRGGEGLALVLTQADGSVQTLPITGNATITSTRAYSAVTLRMAEKDLRALGAEKAAVVVGRQVSLVPRAAAGDPAPLDADEIDYVTGPLRQMATQVFEGDGAGHVAAVMANRLINALPAAGRVSEARRAGLWAQVSAMAPADHPGFERARDILGACRNRVKQGGIFSLRRCLERRHDGLMLDQNQIYWKEMDAGS